MNINLNTTVVEDQKELVARAIDGDDEAFREIYDAHAGHVLKFLMKKSHNREDAEDLTQETFLKAFRKLSGFRSDARLSTWLHRIAFTNFLMLLRNRRTETKSILCSLDDTDDASIKIRSAQRIVDAQLRATVDRVVVLRCIEMMPEGFKRVATRIGIQGYYHQEVADEAGVTIGTSKSQFNKAKKKLRTMIELGPQNVPIRVRRASRR